jgi:hypothetical protein
MKRRIYREVFYELRSTTDNENYSRKVYPFPLTGKGWDRGAQERIKSPLPLSFPAKGKDKGGESKAEQFDFTAKPRTYRQSRIGGGGVNLNHRARFFL